MEKIRQLDIKGISMSHFSLPIVNVSSVGQTEFCPRAGLISHLRSEAGEEQGTFAFLRLPHLGYQPLFELAAIHRRLALHKEKAMQGGILTVVVGLLGLATDALGDSLTGYFVIALTCLPCYFTLLQAWNWLDCWRMLKEYQASNLQGIDLGNRVRQELSWWGILRAGFQSGSLPDNLFSRELQLAGQPFRILKFRGAVIPVLGSRSEGEKIGTSHVSRLAAYCLLIEAARIGKADWGVVLNKRSYTCTAIPITQADKAKAKRLISELRGYIADHKVWNSSPPSGHIHACYGCELGKRRKYIRGRTETRCGKQRIASHPKDGRHSDCGDFFRWQPPRKTFRRTNARESWTQDDWDDYYRDA